MYTDPRHSWAPDVAASFDRPYGKYAQIFDHPLSIGSGEFLLWEFPLCYWLESRGYDANEVVKRLETLRFQVPGVTGLLTPDARGSAHEE